MRHWAMRVRAARLVASQRDLEEVGSRRDDHQEDDVRGGLVAKDSL